MINLKNKKTNNNKNPVVLKSNKTAKHNKKIFFKPILILSEFSIK